MYVHFVRGVRSFFQMEMWIYGLVPLMSGICSAWILKKIKQNM